MRTYTHAEIELLEKNRLTNHLNIEDALDLVEHMNINTDNYGSGVYITLTKKAVRIGIKYDYNRKGILLSIDRTLLTDEEIAEMDNTDLWNVQTILEEKVAAKQAEKQAFSKSVEEGEITPAGKKLLNAKELLKSLKDCDRDSINEYRVDYDGCVEYIKIGMFYITSKLASKMNITPNNRNRKQSKVELYEKIQVYIDSMRSSKIDKLLSLEAVEAVESTETTTDEPVVIEAEKVSVEAANEAIEVNSPEPFTIQKQNEMKNLVKKEAAFILNALTYKETLWIGLNESSPYINDSVHEPLEISDDLYSILRKAVSIGYRESYECEEWCYDAIEIKHMLLNIRKYISQLRSTKIDTLLASSAPSKLAQLASKTLLAA